MGFLDTLKALNGGVPKAILFVQKRKLSYESAEKSTNVNKNISALRNVTKAGKSSSIAKRMAKMKPGQVVGVDTISSTQSQKKQSAAEAETALAQENFLRFEVQYNPNTISTRTSAGRYPEYRAMGDSGNKQFFMVEREATTYLDVQLIFEDVNVQNAFMSENLNPTAGNLVDMAGNVIRTIADDNYSIKNQVEGLVSLLVSNNTRRIVFFWSEMFFHGVVESVDATYTMFNKLGDPIKATVNLTIRQAASGDEYKSDAEYWDKSLKQIFKETGTVSSAMNMANRLFG
ncbi:MAG: hypothetical protein IJT72_02675 [Lachnospiraceae bacterium]|nr:hypothetical protein [Lachnospiraceae bacterium]